MDLDFSEHEIQRYSRHILLPEVGGTGQARLRAARVLVVGAGGLGAPVALYLAAAGVGTIGLVDDDVVELSNLQRQVIHATDTIGRKKTRSAAETLHRLNPLVRVVEHEARLDAANALTLIGQYDLVCDGSDNFRTRYLVNDACALAGRALVSASVSRFSGQLATFAPGNGTGCYRCLHPVPADDAPSCQEAGVLGAVTGVMGTLQATEALKQILDLGETLAGSVLTWDALQMRFVRMRLHSDPDCPLCGAHPAIRDLSAHAGVPA
ncbi:molybdopterin-synthase adenylyltransferase MoeB [Acetobacteraceae bacterium KSS8]|uniref:Molybdopterin-synthase adenylyltransferase MoeB n=1 Tax=Endosaccharibacter trunci TaxID=2812733 RepID=A0ABT1WA56_9PROT|nr:molybdopterin-synthase adenylyltransferase MoeB [Acetobacteraceae bacterium KSS8]